MLVRNQEFFPKPLLVEEKLIIYKFHVLVPLTIFGETHTYMGPLPGPNFNVKKLKAFFPVYYRIKPIIYSEFFC